MLRLSLALIFFIFNFICADPTTPAPVTQEEPIEALELHTSSYQALFFKMILALVVILVLATVAIYLMKTLSQTRIQQGNHYKNIKILEKRSISPKSVLYLIEVGGKKLLIGESQLELRELSHLNWVETEKKGI